MGAQALHIGRDARRFDIEIALGENRPHLRQQVIHGNDRSIGELELFDTKSAGDPTYVRHRDTVDVKLLTIELGRRPIPKPPSGRRMSTRIECNPRLISRPPGDVECGKQARLLIKICTQSQTQVRLRHSSPEQHRVA